MKLIILIIIAIIMDATLHPALAESDIKACIKFQRQDYSWSHAYAVRGFTVCV